MATFNTTLSCLASSSPQWLRSSQAAVYGAASSSSALSASSRWRSSTHRLWRLTLLAHVCSLALRLRASSAWPSSQPLRSPPFSSQSCSAQHSTSTAPSPFQSTQRHHLSSPPSPSTSPNQPGTVPTPCNSSKRRTASSPSPAASSKTKWPTSGAPCTPPACTN